jgi:Bacterial Ig domain/PKD domain
MHPPSVLVILGVALGGLLPGRLQAAGAALIGWSERGVNETAGTDFSVFALDPPGGTIRAQLMVGGFLVTNDADLVVTYEAVSDSSGSINATSVGKGNFYDYAEVLYGTALKPDEGLAGFPMPGPANVPRRMAFNPARHWFFAESVPMTPWDDGGRRNSYPMMRLVARDGAGTLLASTDVALPVSDGLSCRACHASGSPSVARPNGGWVWDCDPDRDYKLNVLQKHDDRHLGSEVYSNALRQAGYDTDGLYVSATRNHQPVLCVRCHASNASPGSGLEGMRPLTQLIHAKHSYVSDPQRGLPLSFFNDSAVCLNCHSGPEERYLRGAHRQAVTGDGSYAIQCQSCHGNMLEVGREGRQGWLEEPNCQSCHTGTVLQNNGEIRYPSAFDAAGQARRAANQTFATQSDTPSVGLDLFSGSQGHGGLSCAACHGPAHGEWPSAQPNENVQSQRLQGNRGALLRCTACHVTTPTTVTGGPHGMHSVNQNWVEKHHDLMGDADNGSALQCRTCHGSTYRGTVLSQAGTENTFSGRGTHQFWRGFRIGCYDCHNDPTHSTLNTNVPPVASSLASATTSANSVAVALPAVDPEGATATLRIISQPMHGRVSLSNGLATYFPEAEFMGNDSFTYSALDGETDSNLGSVDVTVDPGDCVLTSLPVAPRAALPNSPVPFRAGAALARCQGQIEFDWDFGDGAAHAAVSNICHAYLAEGDYTWTLTVTVNGLGYTTNGVITISSTLGPPLRLDIENWYFQMNLSWPWDPIPVALESSTDPANPYSWFPVYDPPWVDPFTMRSSVPVFILPGPQFFRLRHVP